MKERKKRGARRGDQGRESGEEGETSRSVFVRSDRLSAATGLTQEGKQRKRRG